MPEKTYISRKEKTMPGFKAAKDRLTLMLGDNASGDFKPLLVYKAENSRALKNIRKVVFLYFGSLTKKAWVTLAVFENWFFHHMHQVQLYFREKDIPFKDPLDLG